MTTKKIDGPKHLGKTSKGDDTPPQPKRDFTALTPPGAMGSPIQDADQRMAAMHSVQAAAAKTEDRLREEAEVPPEDIPIDDGSPDPNVDEMMRGVISQFQMREQLMTDEQKAIIEERLKDTPVKLEQMYEIGEFRQVIPIVPDQFEAEYRSITPEEDIKIKDMMGKEDENVSFRYLQDKYAVISMVCALRRINDTILPEHFTNQGGWSQKAFDEKSKIIFRMPVPAVWSLMVHNIWFDERCRSVFKLEDLKNG